MTYSLYKTFEDLVVTRDDILEAELLTQQILQAYYPTLDLREGSALRDIVLRPASMVAAVMAKGTEKHLTDTRIDGVTDDTPTETVDSIMSNFFLPRKSGSKAQVVVRVKFSTLLPAASTTVTPASYFSVDNVNRFKPVTTYFLERSTPPSASDTLKKYVSIDEEYYYGDILCESDGEGDQFNITGGSEFLYFTVFDPYFIGATCISLVQESVSTETNLEYVARAPDAISTRNMINNPSISAKLNEQFNYISELLVSGYTDYEMMRDYREIITPISGASIPMHMGGYVDIFLRTSLVERVVQVTTNSSGVVTITGVDPILRITAPAEGESSTVDIYGNEKSSDAILEPGDIAGYTYEDANYDGTGIFYERECGFCPRQNLRIYRTSSALPANSSFDIKVLQWRNLSSVQSFLDDVSSRVICGNYVARGFAVVNIDCTFYVQGAAPTGDALTSLVDGIKAKLDQYTDGIEYAGEFAASEALKHALEASSSYTLSNQVNLSYSLLDGYAREYVPIGVPGANGVIDSDVITSSSGHNESSSIKVARAYVFRINSVQVEGS